MSCEVYRVVCTTSHAIWADWFIFNENVFDPHKKVKSK